MKESGKVLVRAIRAKNLDVFVELSMYNLHKLTIDRKDRRTGMHKVKPGITKITNNKSYIIGETTKRRGRCRTPNIRMHKIK